MLNQWREWLNRNSSVSTAAAVALLLVSLGIIIWTSTGGKHRLPPVVDVWYFDLASGKLFTAKSNMIPPIAASREASVESPTGVRAYLYACGDCPVDIVGKTPEELLISQVFIGWLEMYTPESKGQLEAMARGEYSIEPAAMPGSMMFDSVELGHLVKTLDTDEWVQANSEPGFQIMQNLQMMCGEGRMPKPCFPPRK